jgi:hypothetical protein
MDGHFIKLNPKKESGALNKKQKKGALFLPKTKNKNKTNSKSIKLR